MNTLTIFRSDHRKIMDYEPIRRLWTALVHYTNNQGVYIGWTADGRCTVYGPEDTIEKVRAFVRG